MINLPLIPHGNPPWGNRPQPGVGERRQPGMMERQWRQQAASANRDNMMTDAGSFEPTYTWHDFAVQDMVPSYLNPQQFAPPPQPQEPAPNPFGDLAQAQNAGLQNSPSWLQDAFRQSGGGYNFTPGPASAGLGTQGPKGLPGWQQQSAGLGAFPGLRY